ncbi:MAG: metallophosphoesterase [Bacteroidales bacterium]|nr:metallophosphoesterase [Bacteroidales bacterium]MCF8386973.1 metallophosphoesterase [Bacteroidales bacterium]MCF8397016.1 metallophosphoesterase [Bacteroidales bacterium]
MKFFFVSDLHGKTDRYYKLFSLVRETQPDGLFMGGDLLPHGFSASVAVDDFTHDYLLKNFSALREQMKEDYPGVFLILGNDDPRVNEASFREVEEKEDLWYYLHNRKIKKWGYDFYGYAIVPPTPFRLKDWEKYDVSRYVDPGCIHPTEGFRSVDAEKNLEWTSIKKDLETLAGREDLSKGLFLFHTPPYETNLDRAALDGQMIDHVPLDLHVGSIAVKDFIEEKSPLVSMHGHIHESTRITGEWKEKIGKTWAFNAATDGPELSVVVFDPEKPERAERWLL